MPQLLVCCKIFGACALHPCKYTCKCLQQVRLPSCDRLLAIRRYLYHLPLLAVVMQVMRMDTHLTVQIQFKPNKETTTIKQCAVCDIASHIPQHAVLRVQMLLSKHGQVVCNGQQPDALFFAHFITTAMSATTSDPATS